MKQHDEVNNYVSMLKVLYLGKNSERTIIRYIQGRSRITLGGKKKKKWRKLQNFWVKSSPESIHLLLK